MCVRTFFPYYSIFIYFFSGLLSLVPAGARYLLRCGALLLVVVAGCPESSQGNAENHNHNNTNALGFLFLALGSGV